MNAGDRKIRFSLQSLIVLVTICAFITWITRFGVFAFVVATATVGAVVCSVVVWTHYQRRQAAAVVFGGVVGGGGFMMLGIGSVMLLYTLTAHEQRPDVVGPVLGLFLVFIIYVVPAIFGGGGIGFVMYVAMRLWSRDERKMDVDENESNTAEQQVSAEKK